MSEALTTSDYYGFNLLKKPVWTWEIPGYFFAGGAAGAAALIGAIARRAGGHEALARDARWIAAVGAAVSPPLLISDLGRPERFLNMLRVFKIQSPMSVGAWTLVAFSTAAASAAFADLVRKITNDRFPVTVVADAAEVISAATGMVISTYTGVLIGATAIPVWSQNARILPVHFGASGTGAAVAILELMGHRTRALNRIGIGAALTETVIAAYLESRDDPALTPLREGSVGQLARTAAVLSGPLPLVLRLLAGRSPTARRIAATSTIVGSLLTRIAWVEAGKSKLVLTTEAQSAQRLAGNDRNVAGLGTPPQTLMDTG